MAAPRIVIHIGAPKTGSTSLQRLMRSEPELWRRQGVYVPVLPEVERLAGNAKLLAAVLGAEAPTFRRGFPDIDVAALDPAELVSRLLAGWQPERELLVLSAENLGPAQARPLRALLPDDIAFTIVLFVRNQQSWIESYYRQQVKMMVVDCGMPEFVASVLAADTRHYPDWLGTYRAWREAFGDCRVVVFEQAAPDLLAAFAAAAELPVPPAVRQLAPENVSPDVYEIAYLLALERPVEFPDFRRRRSAASAAAGRYDLPSLRFLTSEDSGRIRARFEPGNRSLLELLGGTYDGSPLDLSQAACDSVTLDDVYRSERYASFRVLAESIYAEGAVVSRGDGSALDPLRRLGRRARRWSATLRRGEQTSGLPDPPGHRPGN